MADTQLQIHGDTEINGFLAYFFENSFFHDLICMNTGNHTGGNLKIDGGSNLHFDLDKKSILSARWVGRIKPEKDGDYHFTTRQNKNNVPQTADGSVVFLLVDSSATDPKDFVYLPSIYMGKQAPVSLKKDTFYDVILEYNAPEPIPFNQLDLQLMWLPPGETQSKVIGEEFVWFPDVSKPIIGRYLTSIDDTFFHYDEFDKLFTNDANQFYMPVAGCTYKGVQPRYV
ncbi:hypothetical protein ACLBXI_28690 [Bacillus cereus]